MNTGRHIWDSNIFQLKQRRFPIFHSCKPKQTTTPPKRWRLKLRSQISRTVHSCYSQLWLSTCVTFFHRAMQGNFKISTLTYEKLSFPLFQDGLRIRSQKKISWSLKVTNQPQRYLRKNFSTSQIPRNQKGASYEWLRKTAIVFVQTADGCMNKDKLYHAVLFEWCKSCSEGLLAPNWSQWHVIF